MAKDAFNEGGNATTLKKGAPEKRVGPHVPMIGQKPPEGKPEVNPRTRVSDVKHFATMRMKSN